jgi:CBS domain-containing protein
MKISGEQSEMTDRPFYDVGDLFSGDNSVLPIPPSTTVGEALKKMLDDRASQLPVVEGGKVKGFFSLWSVAQFLSLPVRKKMKDGFQDVEVGELLMEVHKVNVTDSLDSTVKQLNLYEALLLVSSNRLEAVLTARSVLNYYYNEARPYMLLREIELALRILIQRCASEQFKQCIVRALGHYYGPNKKPPERLEEMSFDDYRSIITFPDNWPIFMRLLGQNRILADMKLEKTRQIRNIAFHFRRKVTSEESDYLLTTRNWLKEKLEPTGSA